MHLKISSKLITSDFRPSLAILASVIGIVALSPYCIYHFFTDRYALGSVILLFVISLIVGQYFLRKDPKSINSAGWVIAPIMVVAASLSLHTLGIMAGYWLFPASIMLFLVMTVKHAAILNTLLVLLALFILVINDAHIETLIRFTVAWVLVNILVGIFVQIIDQQRTYLTNLAIRDPLTGLLNRQTLNNELEKAQYRCNRGAGPSTLMSLDLDYFKKINDTYGHIEGDNALKELAYLLKARLRFSDLVFRVGGEEFLILLDDTSLDAAAVLAEEIRSTIESSHLIKTTLSIGCSASRGNDSVSNWMTRTDNALYRAKNNGRNQVQLIL